jgi:hypothetical protein
MRTWKEIDEHLKRQEYEQRVRLVRRAMFKLTTDDSPAPLSAVAAKSFEDEGFILGLLGAGKLHGYNHVVGPNGGFRRILKVVR